LADLQYVKGLDGILESLKDLPKKVADKVDKGAALAMARVVRKEAVYLCPVYEGKDYRVDTGRLKRAIITKFQPEKSGTYLQQYVVTVRRGKKERAHVRGSKVLNLDAYYWPWIEFGHWYVPPRPKGVLRKGHREKARTEKGAVWVQPRSFLRPSLRLAQAEALKAGEDYYRAFVAQYMVGPTRGPTR
jgi:hypothetical protein